MPYHKSCEKRIRISENSRNSNRQLKSRINTVIKKIRNVKDKETFKLELKNAYSILDKAVKAGVIHKNKAAHQKSNLSNIAQKIKS